MPVLYDPEIVRPLPSFVAIRLGGFAGPGDVEGVGEGVGATGLGSELSLSIFLTVTVDVSVPA